MPEKGAMHGCYDHHRETPKAHCCDPWNLVKRDEINASHGHHGNRLVSFQDFLETPMLLHIGEESFKLDRVKRVWLKIILRGVDVSGREA